MGGEGNIVGAPISPRYRSRSPTIGGNGSPRRNPSNRVPGSPQSPSWYLLSYGDDSMTFELELERVFFLNDKDGLEKEITLAAGEVHAQGHGGPIEKEHVAMLQKKKRAIIDDGEGHFTFLRALAEKVRELMFS